MISRTPAEALRPIFPRHRDGDSVRQMGVVLFCITLLLCGSVPAAPVSNETTLADQSDVAVTVYNNNRALVRDRRTVQLGTGEVHLTFMDVAEAIQPETVSLKSLSSPGGLRILEQNYEYDLMSPQKLMEKYVGKDVRLINKNSDYGFYEQPARLLSLNQGPVYEIDGDIYLGHPGTVVLPEIPGELIAKPSLIWLLDSGEAKHEVEATYLTGGMSWRADYVLSLAKDATRMDLEGWVTLDNRSGATYSNAQLKLVAGDVNVVRPVSMREGGVNEQLDSLGYLANGRAMVEESFAEYHLYTLQRRTTVKQNQSKQVSLLSGKGVAVRKVFEYRGNPSFYAQPMPRFEPEHVSVFLVFKNEEENQLGMPLPEGIMRVYQEDQSGMLQFAGEDRLKHTPKDEEVRLKLGTAFDVVAERKQTDYSKVSGRTHEAAFEIEVRNHKEEAVTVDIIEPMPADWKIIEASQDHTKKDAHAAVFTVDVPADGDAKVTYRVRVTH